MTSTNEKDATTNDQGRRTAAENEPGQPAAAANKRRGKKSSKKKEQQPPPLTGKYDYIKPIVESQRASLRKNMVMHCKAMTKTDSEISSRLGTLARFDGTYTDKYDVDEKGEGKEKSFIPGSLRSKMPLNFSKKVKNDSRCATTLSAITTTMLEAHQAHERYQKEMAKLARTIAEQEIEGRKSILAAQYSEAVLSIAQGLIKVGRIQEEYPTPRTTELNVAHKAINQFFSSAPDHHWDGLKFLTDAEEETVNKFYNDFETHHNIKFDADIKSIFDDESNMEEDETGIDVHPDLALANWVEKQLLSIVPELTTSFWIHEAKQEIARRLDAELDELYEKKEVDNANDELADKMEVEGETIIEDLVKKKTKEARDKEISKRKKEARKNSSGDNKDQESTPREDGHKSKKKSKKKKKNDRSTSTKRQYDHSDDDSDDSYDGRHHDRRSRSRNEEKDYDDYDDHNSRHRRGHYRPKGILRRRSVSWGRSSTPDRPRSRYSREEPLRRQRGTTYHGSHREGRGGRGRGEYSRGGRGERRRRN